MTNLYNEFPGRDTSVVSQKFAYKLGKAFELPQGLKAIFY